MTQTQPALQDELASFSWNTMTPQQAREACRRAQEAAGLPRSEADGGFHVASRYDDVVEVMNDPGTYSSAPTVFRPMTPGVPPFPVLEFDPPQHGPWREIFRELVNPRTVKRMRAQVLADIDYRLDLVIASGQIDLVTDLAEFVPAETICRAAGIDDMDQVVAIREVTLAALLVGGRDPAAFELRMGEFGEAVMPLIVERRAHPREDFLTRLALAEPEGRPLVPGELVGALFGLLAAGHHSTTSAISTLFADVLSRPDVRSALKADPRLVTAAVEESLRLDPPFYGFFRRAARPVEVAGTSLEADDSVLLSWVGANNDPAQFPDPEQFRLDRGPNRHLAFGYGIHTCVGAPLARLELQLALERVLTRMPDIELDGPPPVKYFGGASTTYIESLPAHFTPGAPLGTSGRDEPVAAQG